MLHLSGEVEAQKKISLQGLRLGTEITSLINSFSNDDISHYELAGDLDLHSYLLSFAAGRSEIARRGADFSYLTSGTYFRAGADVNFISSLDGNNAVFLGLRYARSSFSAESSRVVQNALFGEDIIRESDDEMSSFWFEGVIGIKVDVAYNIHMGFTLRNRFLNIVNGEDADLLAYEIPGFGHAEAGSLWAFNYFIQYYLPFK